MKKLALASLAVVVAGGLFSVSAAARTDAITVHGPALEGNLEGNAADREVRVFLPPSYDSNPTKRYPVVYFLHGYFANVGMYDELVAFQAAVDEAAAAGNEVIVVAPDAHTKFKGAMYGASVTTGDFPRFVAEDLVRYIDAHYRTIAKPESRGLSGHSMGGYGTIKIAMTHPGVFSSIYAMAPCCLSPSTVSPDQLAKAQALTDEDIAKAGFGDITTAAMLAAWAPDPKNPPHYIMTDVTDGKVSPLLLGRLAANAPLALLPQKLAELNSLKGIAIDVGDKDFLLPDDTLLHNEMTRYGVSHEWDVFEGDHGNRVSPRFRSHLLPFFAKHLAR